MVKSIQKGKSLILIDKNRQVKKNEKLVVAKFNFSPLALKFLNILIASVKEDDTPDTIYSFNIKQFMEISGKDYKALYSQMKKAVVEVMEKVIQVEDDKKWRAFHIIRNPVIEKGNGVVEVKFDEDIFPLIKETKKRYVAYKMENILQLSSSYAIRIYEILKDVYNNKTYYLKKETLSVKLPAVSEEIEVDFLRDRLEIPASYKFGNIKQRILEPAKEQINRYTDLEFDYEPLKNGKKIEKILFVIKSRCKTEKNIQKNVAADFNTFRQNILKKAVEHGKHVFLCYKDKKYELKNGYLFQNGKILKNEEALTVWNTLYENRKLLIIKTCEQNKKETENDIKDKYITELRKAFGMKIYEYYTKNALGGDEIIKYEIRDIKDVELKEDGSMGDITLLVVNEADETKLLKMSLNALKRGVK